MLWIFKWLPHFIRIMNSFTHPVEQLDFRKKEQLDFCRINVQATFKVTYKEAVRLMLLSSPEFPSNCTFSWANLRSSDQSYTLVRYTRLFPK